MSLTNEIGGVNVQRIIAETLRLSPVHSADESSHTQSQKTSITESYVATPKQYDIPTETLPTELKALHIELYKNYVKALNEISAKLDTASRKSADLHSSDIRSLKQDEVFNINAVHLHELYFANIGDIKSEIAEDNLSCMRLARDFGTFDDWQRDFLACGLSAREGWAVCGFSTFLHRYVNVVIDLHSAGIPLGFYPTIAIDVWTHSIPLGMTRRDYMTAMMREINWEVVENRFKRADRILEALK